MTKPGAGFSAKKWAANPDNPCYRCRKASRVTAYYCRLCADKCKQESSKLRRDRAVAGKCTQCGVGFDSKWKKCGECKAKDAANRHNISLEHFKELASRGCAICGKMDNLAVDHDHKCCPESVSKCGGCVRGMLCYTHNNLVAYLESPDLPKAVAYLAEHEPPIPEDAYLV